MRYALIVALFTCGHLGFSQNGYNDALSERLHRIKNQRYFDNDVVTHRIDSVDYGDLSFPYWKADEKYYLDDMVRYKYSHYQALSDDLQGHRPDTARNSWSLTSGPHPYFFLRDTARSEDLLRLMTDEHPYVRTYCFAALSFRNSGELFSLIVDNLQDTTQLEVAGCAFSNAYPADLMIEYEASKLTKSERRKLTELIKTRHGYLSRGLGTLKRR
jgi:hypothetical protein